MINKNQNLRVYGEVTATAVLDKNTFFKGMGEKVATEVAKGTGVDVTYEYFVCCAQYNSIACTTADYKNAIDALFIEYGDQCANSEFLVNKMKKRFPELPVKDVYVGKCQKRMSYKYPANINGVVRYSAYENILEKTIQANREKNNTI